MKTKREIGLIFFISGFLMIITSCGRSPQNMITEIVLSDKWTLAPDSLHGAEGKAITQNDFASSAWIPVKMPATVLGALADAGIYKDLYFGKNLEAVPRKQFRQPWWYRTEFDITDSADYPVNRLRFEGINYYANIWINGQLVASADSIKGAFRTFDIDISPFVHNGKNILAVQVFPPKPGDYYMGFVDWTPRPPDENMGLFRPVILRRSGKVSINNVSIQSRIDTKTLSEAFLTVEAEVINHSAGKIKAFVSGEINGALFQKKVRLGPGEKQKVLFTADRYKVLHIKNPRLWWPYQYGEPALYTASFGCFSGNKQIDYQRVTFGIRQVEDFINEFGNRAYKINGKYIQIRGGGWTDDLLLREDTAKLEAQVRYTRLMNLNTIRLEGFWGSSHALYDLCDRYGILLMAGWSCQWEWQEYIGGKPCDEFGAVKSPEDIDLVSRMMHDQVTMFRNHPSIFVWVFGSDKLPRPELEKRYIDDLKNTDPTRPTLSACSRRTSEVSGPTGVKMEGPYDYVTPNYWYVDSLHGGAYGFNTETGPGPQIPPIETLQKMFPQDKIWPVNDYWDYHCGRNEFNTINRYRHAMDMRYGSSRNLEEFLKKAQLMNYEAIRPMFEAFAVNKAKATGIIQWMLNAAWPKLYWQLYDYYLMPNGAFFGTGKACEPLHAVYNYGDHCIYLSNDLYQPRENLKLTIQAIDMEGNFLVNDSVTTEIQEYSSKKVYDMPAFNPDTKVYFLNLRLTENANSLISENFYWLSSKEDVLDEKKSEWFVTPNSSYADFTALNHMPSATLEVTASKSENDDLSTINITLKNPSSVVAFFVEMKLKNHANGDLVLPVYWSDNYVSLLPGKSKNITVQFNNSSLKGGKPIIEVSGWNIPKFIIESL
ncbi:MAG TPA: glycoside hydrolase family 2 TIM barrel-domain containing protein [Bacteroidales bacterium]|nr:glycoside hydrolase family 2 TIM barrel-domain containing protein [Bacteroidales bacterium]HRT48722.1 glycoside hydrolase family 2 TIM barrel-domain containing protein [Bacteroidales bacterium]